MTTEATLRPNAGTAGESGNAPPLPPRKQIRLSKEMRTAADAALDRRMILRDAREKFTYTFLQRAINRYGSESEAARQLGLSRQQLNSQLARLEVRLAP